MLSQISTAKTLCILRLSAIGDVCHAVAMVQQVQRQCPNITITWVIGKVEANLLTNLAGVEFIIFDKRAGFKGYQALRVQLKGRKFDVLFHMQVALRASLVSLCIPAKIKIGFDHNRAKEGQWLFTNKKIASQTHPHVLDGFMGFAQTLGSTTQTPKWHMAINDQDLLWAGEQLQYEKPIAVISPAASKTERNWPPERYASIADHLADLGFCVVICGGSTAMEINLAENILHFSSTKIINLVTKTSLKQLLAVLKLAHLVIAPDTGPAHMAVTVNTPVIGLYAHSNPHRTGPYNCQHYVVSCYKEVIEKQYNKPLAKLPWGIRAKGENLMSGITVQQVKDKIYQLVADHYPELSKSKEL